MARTLEQLDAEVTALRAEMGPVVDTGALPVHERIVQLGDAENGVVARMEGIPGGTRITDYVNERIAGIPPSSQAPVDAAAVIAALALSRVYIEKDPETNRVYVGIGMRPNFNDWSPIQIGGGLAGQISAYGSTQNVPGQGSGSPNSVTSVVFLDGDGGFRVRQYGIFGKKGFIRNTLSRPFTVLAMDSVGEVCQSQVPIGATADGGQNWYIKTDWVNKLVRFLTFKPGWSVSIERCSTTYADADVKQKLPQEPQ